MIAALFGLVGGGGGGSSDYNEGSLKACPICCSTGAFRSGIYSSVRALKSRERVSRCVVRSVATAEDSCFVNLMTRVRILSKSPSWQFRGALVPSKLHKASCLERDATHLAGQTDRLARKGPSFQRLDGLSFFRLFPLHLDWRTDSYNMARR